MSWNVLVINNGLYPLTQFTNSNEYVPWKNCFVIHWVGLVVSPILSLVFFLFFCHTSCQSRCLCISTAVNYLYIMQYTTCTFPKILWNEIYSQHHFILLSKLNGRKKICSYEKYKKFMNYELPYCSKPAQLRFCLIKRTHRRTL